MTDKLHKNGSTPNYTSTDEINQDCSVSALKTVDNYARQKRKLIKHRERRATIILGLIMGAFILCWFPFFYHIRGGNSLPKSALLAAASERGMRLHLRAIVLTSSFGWATATVP